MDVATSRLQEIPEKNRKVHITALDGWRGIACLLVLFYHTGSNIFFPPFVIYGFIGLHLFFVLSGYLISSPFLKAILNRSALPSTGRFYMRRLIRIYPPYLVSLAIFTVLRHVTHTKSPPISNLLSHAALIFNYFSRTEFFSINPVLWSLAVEMQFYLLMPLLILLIVALFKAAPERAALTVPLVFIGIGIVSRTVEVLFINPAGTAAEDLVRYRSVFSFLDCFGLGMLVAYSQQARTRIPQVVGIGRAAVPAIGILLLVIASDWGLYTAHGAWLTATDPVYTICSPLVICIGVALLLYSVLNIGGVARGLSTKALTLAGTISYSIYLYHVGVQVIVVHYVKIGQQLGYQEKAFAYAAVSLIPTLALATLMYWAVERPSLVWAAKWKEQAR